MNKFLLISLAVSLMTLSACQIVPKAREVKKKPMSNGVIAIPSSYRPEDREKADQLMRTNCANGKVTVVDEGEVVIGQNTQSSGSTTNRDDTRQDAGSLFGIPVTSGSGSGTENRSNATTTQLTEWQITYNCDTDKPKARK